MSATAFIEVLTHVARCHISLSLTSNSKEEWRITNTHIERTLDEQTSSLALPLELNITRAVVSSESGAPVIEIQVPILQMGQFGVPLWQDSDSGILRTLHCRFCKQVLIRIGEPCRRLMLPSETWFELAEECSCNAPHFTAQHPLEDTNLAKPRPRVVMEGGDFYLVHKSDLVNVVTAMRFASESRSNELVLKCERCNAQLGHGHRSFKQAANATEQLKQYDAFALLESAHFDKYSTVAEFIDTITPMATLPQHIRTNTIWQQLANDIQRRCQEDGRSRFLLYGLLNNVPICTVLIWLFGNVVSWISTEPPAPQLQEHRLGETKLDKEVQSNTWHLAPVLKVLYVDCLDPPEQIASLVKAWQSDRGAERIDVAWEIGLNAIQLLRQSTLRLPPSRRQLNSLFRVGYLPQ